MKNKIKIEDWQDPAILVDQKKKKKKRTHEEKK